jgi:hypothetical protein
LDAAEAGFSCGLRSGLCPALTAPARAGFCILRQKSFETRSLGCILRAMSTDKSGEDRIRQQTIQEATLVARAVQLDEAERRLRELEGRVFAKHTQTMTWILTAISAVMGLAAVTVTILGFFSKSEVNEEVREMRKAVKDETERSEVRFEKMKADFQQQFTAFAGDALKKPRVEISIASGQLTNQILHLTPGPPSGQIQVPLYPLFIKNVGQKSTGPISIYLYSSAQFGYYGSGRWEPEASNEPEFHFRYHFQLGAISPLELAPGEPWSYAGDYPGSQFFTWAGGTNIVSCKLVVFYGGESPAEARFQLKNGP